MMWLDWFLERSGLRQIKKTILDHQVPRNAGFFYTLGDVTLFLFVLQAITGVLLAMYYSPSPDHAYDSVRYITEQVPMGWFIRGLHKWGATAMVLAVFLHFLHVFFSAAYKYPRQVTWFTGVALLVTVLGFAFTGYLLPWDQKAYWATAVGTNIAGQVPMIGPYLSTIMKGGANLGALTLARFFATHVLLLPAVILSLIGCHLFLILFHGISAPAERRKKGEVYKNDEEERKTVDDHYEEAVKRGVPFYPDIIVKISGSVLVVFLILCYAAFKMGAPLEGMADPTSSAYNPRPEWYFLFFFQLLKYFPGRLEFLGTVVVPGLIVGILVAMPFLDRGYRRHFLDRPWVTGLGVVALGLVVFLGVQGARSPMLNSGAKEDPAISQGKKLFQDLRCQYCHSLGGRGGSVGPALDIESSKRDRIWLAMHFRDPQKVTQGSVMPNMHLLDAEVDSLTAYMCSLGGGPYTARAKVVFEESCATCHSLKGKNTANGPDLSRVGLYRDPRWIADYIKNPDKMSKDAAMTGFDGILSPAEIEDLSRFLSAQRGLAVQ